MIEPWQIPAQGNLAAAIVAAAAATAVLSAWLFALASGSLRLRFINPVAVIYYLPLLTQNLIAATITLLGTSHYLIDKVGPVAKLHAFGAVLYTMLTLPLAIITIQCCLAGGRIMMPRLLRRFYRNPIEPTRPGGERAVETYWVVLSAVAVLSTLYTLAAAGFEHFVIASLQGAGAHSLALLRQRITHLFDAFPYVRNIGALFLAPIACYISFVYWRIRRDRRHLLWFLVMVGTALTIITMTGEKAPIIKLTVTLIVIDHVLRRGKVRAGLLFAPLLAIVLVIATYRLSGADSLPLAINSGPVGRIVMSEHAAVPLTFAAFPERHPFLRGRSLPGWMIRPFGLKHERSSKTISRIFRPREERAGTAGVINGLFVAEAWANAGPFGMLIAPWLVGFVVGALMYLLLVQRKTPLTVGLFGYAFFAFPIDGGFVDFLWNPTWMLVVAVFVGSYWIPQLLSISAGRLAGVRSVSFRSQEG